MTLSFSTKGEEIFYSTGLRALYLIKELGSIIPILRQKLADAICWQTSHKPGQDQPGVLEIESYPLQATSTGYGLRTA